MMSVNTTAEETRAQEPAQPQQNQTRWFTYPQGEISILPQILNIMAAFCTIMAFNVFDGNGTRNFLCLEYKENDEYRAPECAPLALSNSDFWETGSSNSWGGAIQAGAFFGIVAAVCGTVAAGLLIAATCFPLKARRLLTISIMQASSALLAAATLIAFAADYCDTKKSTSTTTTTCQKERARADTGANFMIFSAILYIAAAVMTFLYYWTIRKESLPTRLPRGTRGPPSVVQHSVNSSLPTIFVLPDGSKRIEREYVDEQGKVVKEVTIQPPATIEEEEDGL